MLSTPPAFILSQDQTLNKKFFPSTDQRFLLIWLLLFLFRYSFSEISDNRNSELKFLIPFDFAMLRIVRELLTRVPQASLRPRLKSPRRASRFEVFIWNLQGCIVVYLSRFNCCPVLCDSFVIIPRVNPVVNSFLKIFRWFLKNLQEMRKEAYFLANRLQEQS